MQTLELRASLEPFIDTNTVIYTPCMLHHSALYHEMLLLTCLSFLYIEYLSCTLCLVLYLSDGCLEIIEKHEVSISAKLKETIASEYMAYGTLVVEQEAVARARLVRD